MKKIIPTIVSIILLISIGFYYKYFNDNKLYEEKTEKTIIWELDNNEIKEIGYTNNDFSINIKRSGLNYNISSPIKARGDEYIITNIINSISKIKTNNIISIDKNNLKDYGIDDSKKVILNNDYTLILGDETPVYGERYAYYKEKDILFILNNNLNEVFPNDINEYRTKNIIDIDFNDVSQINIKAINDIEIIKNDDGIWIENFSPNSNTLNSDKIQGFVNSITSSINNFVVDNASKDDLEEYSLDTPSAIIVLKYSSSTPATTIYIGKTGIGENVHYICIDNKEYIYEKIDSSLNIENLNIKTFRD